MNQFFCIVCVCSNVSGISGGSCQDRNLVSQKLRQTLNTFRQAEINDHKVERKEENRDDGNNRRVDHILTRRPRHAFHFQFYVTVELFGVGYLLTNHPDSNRCYFCCSAHLETSLTISGRGTRI